VTAARMIAPPRSTGGTPSPGSSGAAMPIGDARKKLEELYRDRAHNPRKWRGREEDFAKEEAKLRKAARA